jgi:hypothetical protein
VVGQERFAIDHGEQRARFSTYFPSWQQGRSPLPALIHGYQDLGSGRWIFVEVFSHVFAWLKSKTVISTAKIELFHEKIEGRKRNCFASSNALDLTKSRTWA